jgi:AraC-like DNA-binding protein
MLMSRNYAPSKAMAPFIARHYVFSAELPESMTLTDSLLAETAFIRILVQGDWSVEVAPEHWVGVKGTILSGANIRPFPVRVKGSFLVVGIALRPCGWRALFSQPASIFADKFLSLGDVWGDDARLLQQAVEGLRDDAAIVAAIEAQLSRRLRPLGDQPVDETMRKFEFIARRDSTRQVQTVATEIGLSGRQLERLSRACFGHSPKQILRRSRFLDMATVMRGLAEPSEADLAALRYFDQSHLTREFRQFIGLTPQQFRQTPTPLLTAGLELRAERKREAKVD